MKSAVLFSAILAGSAAVSGCQYLTPGAAGEIRHVNLPGQDLAMTATHRLVITGDRIEDDKGIICTEPSPDAMSIVASSFALSAQIMGKGGGSLAGGFNQAAVPLFARSQTIQAIRDTVTAACLAYQNGIMPKFGYYMVIAAYPDLLIGMHAIEGITDRPLQLAGGAFAPAPAISTTLNSEENEDGEQAQSASITTSIAAAKAQVAQPGAPTTTRFTFAKEAVAEIRGIADDHPNGQKVFTSACMMYLADKEVIKTAAGTPIYEQCKLAVNALTGVITNKAKKEEIGKIIDKKIKETGNKLTALEKKFDKSVEKNYETQLKQAIGHFVVEDFVRRPPSPK